MIACGEAADERRSSTRFSNFNKKARNVSTMDVNAALRTIVHRDDGRTYREMLTQMAKESGIETPRADDLVRIDRTRKGQETVEPRVDQQDRSRGQDRQAEERSDALGL